MRVGLAGKIIPRPHLEKKMALHYDALPINLVVDDGEFLVFQIVSDGGAVVTATLGIKLSSGPATWVEAVKYGYRAQVDLQVIWDDASTTTYHSPAFAGLPPFTLNKLLAVTG
jgi:hypothetical protein